MPSQLPKPTTIGKYTLLERISHGGMAEVFRARTEGEAGYERVVAIKVLLPQVAMDQDFVTMLIDEAKIAGQLSHANIAQIFDLGEADERYYIVQEYVPGRDLRAILRHLAERKERLPLAQACHIVLKMCEGLDYAHNKRDAAGGPLNLVHRDISPQNVIVSYEGEVKLIDFGIVKAEGRATRTMAGLVKGKFAYMSPEQLRGLPVDRRSDVFACGIVLHELLTGHPLFKRATEFETLRRARSGEIEPPSRLNPEVPPELDRIALKALARHVDDRYQTAGQLRDDLWELVRREHVVSRDELAAWMRETFPEGIPARGGVVEIVPADADEPDDVEDDDADEAGEDGGDGSDGSDYGDHGEMMTLIDPQLQSRFLGDGDGDDDGEGAADRLTLPGAAAPRVRDLARAAMRDPGRAVFTPEEPEEPEGRDAPATPAPALVGSRLAAGSDPSIDLGEEEETTSSRDAGETEPLTGAPWVEPQTPTARRPRPSAPGASPFDPSVATAATLTPGQVEAEPELAVRPKPGLGPDPRAPGSRPLPGIAPGPGLAPPAPRPGAVSSPPPGPAPSPAVVLGPPPGPAVGPTPSPAPGPPPGPAVGPGPMHGPMPGPRPGPMPGPMSGPPPGPVFGPTPTPGPVPFPMHGPGPLPPGALHGPGALPGPGRHPASLAPPAAGLLAPGPRRWLIGGALLVLVAAAVLSIILASSGG